MCNSYMYLSKNVVQGTEREQELERSGNFEIAFQLIIGQLGCHYLATADYHECSLTASDRPACKIKYQHTCMLR